MSALEPVVASEAFPVRRLGKYDVFGVFAKGGMATIHVGRLHGPAGFSKLVAVKQVSSPLAKSERHAKMLLEEARVSARIRSPYVVPILDVVHEGEELCLVMELVRGVPLSSLIDAANTRGESVDPSLISAMISDALRGLHAAHEATDASGRSLQLVHRDVSPQNLIVGADGITRVLDFGVAKARGAQESLTQAGEIKGKLRYMAPEQGLGQTTRQSDVYAAGLVLWEGLTGKRVRPERVGTESIAEMVNAEVPSPRAKGARISSELDEVVMSAVAREPSRRFATAEVMALALEEACPPASRDRVGAFVERFGFELLESLDQATRDCEAASAVVMVAPPSPRRPLVPMAIAVSVVAGLAVASLVRVVSTPDVVPPAVAAGADEEPLALESPGAPPRASIAPLAALPSEPPPPSIAPSAPPPSEPPSVGSPREAPGPAVPVSEAPRPASRPRASAGASSAAAASKDGCFPPFSYDENGHKRYKRECLP